MMGKSPFYGRLIQCLLDESVAGRHLFVVRKDNDFPRNPGPNFRTLEYPSVPAGRLGWWRPNAKLWRLLKAADLVVFHALLQSGYLVPVNLCPGALRRGLWVAWGGDLSTASSVSNSRKPQLTRFLWERAAKNMGRYAALAPGDEELLNQIAGRNVRCSRAIYFTDQSLDQVEALWEARTERPTGPIRVLVGNSATPTNRHLEVLELLARYEPGEVEVFVPLGYGDSIYAQQVAAQGSMLLGERFHPLIQQLQPSEFTSLANQMDVAVFNHDRQQGLGTILLMAALGKKVFLPRENSAWSLLAHEVGIPISDTNLISELGAREFSALPERDRMQLHEGAMRWLSSSNVGKMWSDMMEVGT